MSAGVTRRLLGMTSPSSVVQSAPAVDHVTADVGQGSLLAEEKAIAGHPVLQGQRLHSQTAVVVDDLVFRGVNSVEDNVELQSRAKHLQLHVEQGTHCCRRVDVQRRGTSQHAHGGDEAYQSEAVVAMEMRDKHRLNLGEADMVFPHLQLRALATVDHEELAPQLNDLRGSTVPKCGQGTATA